MRGTFIALYGVNNIGKTTQARLLVERLQKEWGGTVEYLKYPLYDLVPTGPIINGYLRGGNPYALNETAFQILQFANRYQYNDTLDAKLTSGTHVVAEDYWGTGVAWGMGGGVSKELLIRLAEGIAREDVAVLLDGERFTDAEEQNHKHENDEALVTRVREAHLELARDFMWATVGANDTIERVHEAVYTSVMNLRR